MNGLELQRSYRDLTTPHVADEVVRLGNAVRCAPANARPVLVGSHIVGRVQPARHYGSVDVFLEALEHAESGDVLVVDNGGRDDEACVGDLIALEVPEDVAVAPRPHRPVPDGMTHHSAGSQYTSIRYTDTLVLEGLKASIGSVGDAYDNAAAETVMGLFKNEAIAKESPFRARPLKHEADVEEITFDWVEWYNNERLHSALGNIPPEEYEQTYYAQNRGPSTGDAANKTAA